MKDIKKVEAKALYTKLSTKRNNYLTRAQDASELTLPQLYPRSESESEDITYGTPYQSLGARGVNNLANKIILTLFPPATAFFKLGINPLMLQQMSKGEGEINSALYALEKGIVNEMEISQLRAALVELLKQNIVGGSSLLHVPEGENPRVISMRNFVINRSKSGKVLEICIKDSMNFIELDKETQKQLVDISDDVRKGKKPLEVYTLVQRDSSEMFSVIQEINKIKIDGTHGTYREQDLPYIFVPFVDRGESYGRSFIEDYIGDLRSYEGLRKAILEASAEAARLIYLVKPNATLSVKKLRDANSGDVLVGVGDDVSVLQADKRLDVGMAQQEAEILRQDLSTLFLLDSAVRRNAERVTAEEIRKISQELEVSLGGIYSTLANVLQSPLVRLYLNKLKKKGLINDALKDSINLEVTTGSAALGRGTEFTAISTFLQTMQQVLGEQFTTYMKMPELIARVANSLDIGTSELVKSEEELMMEQQQAQEQAMQQQAVGPAIQAASKQQEE